MGRQLTHKEFMQKFDKVEKLSYVSIRSVYTGRFKEIVAYCTIHDCEFSTTPNILLIGSCSCPMCVTNKPLTKEMLSMRVEKIDSVKQVKIIGDYKNMHTKIECLCTIHNATFKAKPVHLLRGQNGCEQCGLKNVKHTYDFAFEQFKKRNYKMLDNNYINCSTKIRYICSKHHDIEQRITLDNLMRGKGCRFCAIDSSKEKQSMTNSDYVYKLKSMSRYIVPIEKYKNARTNILHRCLVCDYKWSVRPDNIITGGTGCPKCKESRLERVVSNFLDRHNVSYTRQKKIEGVIYIRPLLYDFHIPEYNILIEAQGQQHYYPSDRFGGEEAFRTQQIKDQIKRDYCKENNIKLIEIPYWDIKNIPDILTRELKLHKAIS